MSTATKKATTKKVTDAVALTTLRQKFGRHKKPFTMEDIRAAFKASSGHRRTERLIKNKQVKKVDHNHYELLPVR